MPWRQYPTLYNVVVSEMMLQQTQVSRVIPKFVAFVGRFPDFNTLAQASQARVLESWQGLGYNRRAKFLHETAQQIVNGASTVSQSDLASLPGIGLNTAGAILNYAYNIPTAFIETNIRTVYFHHFFHDFDTVTDRQILALVDATMDKDNPREWFWALMDYGADLKRQGYAHNTKSRYYKKQSKFDGSLRQMRGEIVRRLTQGQSVSEITQLLRHDTRFEVAMQGLHKDGLLNDY